MLLNQGFKDKTSKYSQIAKDSNVSFVPLIFLDTGKAHHCCQVHKTAMFCCYPWWSKNRSVAIGNSWIVRFSLLQKQNAITIKSSIKTARQKVLRTGASTHHEYNNDYLNSHQIANIYFGFKLYALWIYFAIFPLLH